MDICNKDMDINNLDEVISLVRQELAKSNYDSAEHLVKKALSEHPHSAIPHNLYGVLLERKSMHSEAMKHFRAAWSLDPTYLPSRYNMDILAAFGNTKSPVFCEDDINRATKAKNSNKKNTTNARKL